MDKVIDVKLAKCVELNIFTQLEADVLRKTFGAQRVVEIEEPHLEAVRDLISYAPPGFTVG